MSTAEMHIQSNFSTSRTSVLMKTCHGKLFSANNAAYPKNESICGQGSGMIKCKTFELLRETERKQQVATNIGLPVTLSLC